MREELEILASPRAYKGGELGIFPSIGTYMEKENSEFFLVSEPIKSGRARNFSKSQTLIFVWGISIFNAGKKFILSLRLLRCRALACSTKELESK